VLRARRGCCIEARHNFVTPSQFLNSGLLLLLHAAPGEPRSATLYDLLRATSTVEDAFARPVPYGVLQYSDARRQIPFTADRKREVLQLADETRRKRGYQDVHRQHQHIGRCRKCGYRSVCEDFKLDRVRTLLAIPVEG
jgi:hypothetical protein